MNDTEQSFLFGCLIGTMVMLGIILSIDILKYMNRLSHIREGRAQFNSQSGNFEYFKFPAEEAE